MARRLITASDVLAASEAGALPVPRDAIITPLARDEAAARGVRLVTESTSPAAQPTEADLTAKVRTIVASMLAGAFEPQRPPVKLASIRETVLEKFGYPGPPPGMTVLAKDVITSDDGSPMAAGYLSLTAGSFPWTLTYDEVQIVLEGELHLGGDAGNKVGYPGDVLYVPKGSSITFGTPTWAKFVYVTFPANWEESIS